MTTAFSSLPILDIGTLRNAELSTDELKTLSKQLYHVFATTGFAYLVNPPLSFSHGDVFEIAREFFALPMETKMGLAKKSFRPSNANSYRGYFPAQPHLAEDNLKEGFEVGPPRLNQGLSLRSKPSNINLSEQNIWPAKGDFGAQERLEQLYDELQALSSQLLSLLGVALGKDADLFSAYLENSLSTLRLLHYPPVPQHYGLSEDFENESAKLSCTPHTDSGILTLLHQDSTGGLEVRNAAGEWVAAPYVPNSIVVNIGDLMARVSGGRLTATVHRVRAPGGKKGSSGDGLGRFSVPFFFEPGEECVIRPVDGTEDPVVYGEHVREKMAGWVEFQDDSGYDTGN